MNDCLTTEQILNLAWLLDDDAPLRDHVSRCESCRRQVEQWQAVPAHLRTEVASQDRIEAGRDRLLAAITEDGASPQNENTSLPDSSSEGPDGAAAPHVSPLRKIGAIAMRHKMTLTVACLVAVLAVVFRPLPGSGESLAQETARAISEAKSLRFRMTQKVKVTLGGKPLDMTMNGRGFWKSGGAQRIEMSQGDKVENVAIMFRDKMGIDINHRAKTFRTTSSRAGQMSPLMKLQKLGSFEGKADQLLGEKKVEGVSSSGFELAMSKVDDAVENGTMQVWVAQKTHLPVRVVYSMSFGGQKATVTMDQFEWNIALDESLFNATPPPGYTDNTPTPPDAATLTREITRALKVYAKLFDGHYPKGSTVYGDVVIAAVRDKMNLSGLTPAEQSLRPSYEEFSGARLGFAMLSTLLRDNPKAGWHGKTVTAKDADKVLLYWQSADGFEVIFGDQKAKSVKSEAELKSLLKK